jgi:hypothetical protein
VAVANRRRSGEGALTAEERVALAQARAGRDIDVYLADEEAEQCRLLRDLFHSPSVKPVIDPEWLTPTVVLLARGIHDERTFDRLPYLADALQDGGCDDERVLEHCRGPGPHVRGCWAVDLVLGKT